MVNLGNDWNDLLKDEFSKEYYLKLRQFLKCEYSNHTIFPDMNDIFNAIKHTSFADVKVVILGQDPYHGENQAHGFCFSVKKGIPLPPSLINIFKEIKLEYGYEIPTHGELTSWANQGVLLLNTCLTVRHKCANSHAKMGWEIFTDKIISTLNNKQTPVVYLLWGANAKSKAALITNPKHLILTSVHPSPLSAHGGFFGCNHFKKANDFLLLNNLKPINWQVN